MAVTGWILMISGVVLITAGFGMDAGVDVPYRSGSFGLPSRVVNAQMLHTKTSLIHVGSAGFVAGAVFLSAANAVAMLLASSGRVASVPDSDTPTGTTHVAAVADAVPASPSVASPLDRFYATPMPVRRPRRKAPLTTAEMDTALKEAADGRGYFYRTYRILRLTRDPANPRFRAVGDEYTDLQEAMRAIDRDLT